MAVLISTIAVFFIAELLLRLAWQNPFAEETSDHLVPLHVHHAGRNLRVSRSAIDPALPPVRLRVDSRSYALPGSQVAESDTTIAFLGGSTTECSAVEENNRFPQIVGKILSEKKITARILNAAKSGGTLHDSLNILLNHVVYDRPDVLVVMHAVNDVGMLRRSNSYRERSSQELSLRHILRWSLHRTSIMSSLGGLARLAFTSSPAPPATPKQSRKAPLDPSPFEIRLRTLVDMAKHFGITPVLMTQPIASFRNSLTPLWLEPEAQEQFNGLVRSVAKDTNTLLIDLVEHLNQAVEDKDTPMAIFYDAVHVTDRGSRVYGRYIADRLLASVYRDSSQLDTGNQPFPDTKVAETP